MRIVTWNCAGAFRNKYDIVLKSLPDILLIQECEPLEKIDLSKWVIAPHKTFYYGEKNKGVAVFTFNNFKIEKLACHNEDFRFIIPLKICNGKLSFNFLATWTKRTDDDCYTRQIFDAVKFYDKHAPELLQNNPIIIGDFNSNSIWDKPNRECNHSNFVEYLEKKKIYSAYHEYFKEEQGKESQPTLYFTRNKQKTYHIDYCFTSQYLLNKLSFINIGKYDDFISHSDHMPLILDFDVY